MNKLPRIFTAGFLALGLALPNPAWALRPQTDRSGLEEKLSIHPQPVEGQELRTGLEEWPGFLDPGDFGRIMVWLSEQLFEGPLRFQRNRITLPEISRHIQSAAASGQETGLLGQVSREKVEFFVQKLPFLITGQPNPPPEALPQGPQLTRFFNFFLEIAATVIELNRESKIRMEMTSREMADEVLRQFFSTALSGRPSQVGSPELNLQLADVFMTAEEQRLATVRVLEVLHSSAGLEEPPSGARPQPSARDWLNYGLTQEKDHPEEAARAFENALKADRSLNEAWVGLTRAIIADRKLPSASAGRKPWPRRVAEFHEIWAVLMDQAIAEGTDSETLLKIFGRNRDKFHQIDLTPERFLYVLLGPPPWAPRAKRPLYHWDELAQERFWMLGGLAAIAIEIRSTDPAAIHRQLGLRLSELGFTGPNFRSLTPSIRAMIKRMLEVLQVRTGLEERGRELVRMTAQEMPKEGSGIVVLDAALLRDPAWLEAARALASETHWLFYNRVVIWGEPADEEVKNHLRWARPITSDLASHLKQMREVNSRLEKVFFLGSEAEAYTVGRAIPPGFTYVPMMPSEFAFLVGFGIPQDRASEIAAGLEEESVLGSQL